MALPPDAATQAQVSSSHGRLPLGFEINRGQTDSQVRFLARGQSYGLFLTPREAVLSLRVAQAKTAQAKARKLATGKEAKADEGVRSTVVRMRLARANSNPEISGLDPMPGRSNYFIGNDPDKWQTQITHYARVKYAGVYPGIDLIYYGNQRQLEYDFVLAPGADPKLIELIFAGTRSLSLDKQGNLILATAGGELVQRKPVVYQEADGRRTEVEGSYVLRGRNRAGFHVASYDFRRPLVIDPVLSYSTYLGGGGTDASYGIAVDAGGNAYVTGVTASSIFPTTAGAYQRVYGFGGDAFVTKLNAGGSALVYSTYLGGSGLDQAWSIAVDASGNAYVTGYTASSNFPTTAGAYQAVYGGGSNDVFVTKLNAAGTALIYSTFLGGSGEDEGYAIALDASGNAYVTGVTGYGNFPTTAGAYQTFSGGGYDVFATKLNAAGSALVYSTLLGGSGEDDGSSIVVDGGGNAYVAGSTASSNFPTTAGAYQRVYGGGVDAFVTKLNAAGSALVYSTFLGGSGEESGFGIALDGSGYAYVTGATASSNFPTTAGAYQVVYGGGNDAFVTKLNATGTALIYSTLLGGSGEDKGYGIAVDASSNAYATGATASSNFPTTADAYQAVYAGGGDAFVTTLNATGTALAYSTYLGGSGEDKGYGIPIDGSGNVYVTGYTKSSNFSTTPGAYQPVYGGGSSDVFIAKFSALGMLPQCTLTALPSTITAGQSSNLTATCSPAATSYAWTTQGMYLGFPATASAGTVSPTVTTTYSVIGSNAAGSGNTASATVTVTVVACTYSLFPTSQSVTASASTGTLSVTSASGCAWTATSNADWITITSSSGSGSGTVVYAVAANPSGSSRTGTLSIAGQTFTVTQAGLTVPICTLTASPSAITVGQSSTLTATCNPAATSYAWINTGFAATASGGTVSPTVTTTYSVIGGNAAGNGNTDSATVTVTCTYSISPTSQSVAAIATTGTLNVTTASGCAWTTTSNAAWITITSGNSGSGNGTVGYAVAANSSGSSRTGALTIAGQTFTVTQAGLAAPSCTLTASPGTITAGQSSTLTATCSPAATSYTWTNTGFAATAFSGTVSPSATTTYSVAGSNAAGSGNTANATVTVTATAINYTISTAANPTAGGSVTCIPNPVPSGSSSTCTATANSGYTFSNWGGGCFGTTATCTLSNVTAQKTVTAVFNLKSNQAFEVIDDYSGDTSSLTLDLTLYVNSADIGTQGSIYLGAWVPVSATQNAWFFHDGASWVNWTGGGMPTYFTGTLPTSKNFSILRNNNALALAGTDIYAGYGRDVNDMLDRGNVKLGYTVPKSSSGGEFQFGTPKTYGVSGTTDTHIYDSLTGNTFRFPNGGNGNLTITSITSVPEDGPAGGSSFKVEYSDADSMQILVPHNANEIPLLWLWGDPGGSTYDPSRPAETWLPLPNRDTTSNPAVFDLSRSGSLANSSKTSLQAQAPLQTTTEPPRILVAKLNSGSWFFRRGQELLALASQDIQNIVFMLPEAEGVRDNALDEINGRLNAFMFPNAVQFSGISKYHPFSYLTGNADPYFVFVVTDHLYGSRANENTVAHEVGHYMSHVLLGDDLMRILNKQAAKDHGKGILHTGRPMVEEYAYFSDYVINYEFKGKGSSIETFYTYKGGGTPATQDWPSKEGYATSLLAKMHTDNPDQVSIFSNVDDVTEAIPLIKADLTDLWGILAKKPLTVDQLYVSIENFLSKRGALDKLSPLLERSGWSYHGTGQVVDSQGRAMPFAMVQAVAKAPSEGANKEYLEPPAPVNADKDGIFTLDRIFPGSNLIRVWPAEGSTFTDFPFTVSAAKPTNEKLALGTFAVTPPSLGSISINANGFSGTITDYSDVVTFTATVNVSGTTSQRVSWSLEVISTNQLPPVVPSLGNIVIDWKADPNGKVMRYEPPWCGSGCKYVYRLHCRLNADPKIEATYVITVDYAP